MTRRQKLQLGVSLMKVNTEGAVRNSEAQFLQVLVFPQAVFSFSRVSVSVTRAVGVLLYENNSTILLTHSPEWNM